MDGLTDKCNDTISPPPPYHHITTTHPSTTTNHSRPDRKQQVAQNAIPSPSTSHLPLLASTRPSPGELLQRPSPAWRAREVPRIYRVHNKHRGVGRSREVELSSRCSGGPQKLSSRYICSNHRHQRHSISAIPSITSIPSHPSHMYSSKTSPAQPSSYPPSDSSLSHPSSLSLPPPHPPHHTTSTQVPLSPHPSPSTQ